MKTKKSSHTKSGYLKGIRFFLYDTEERMWADMTKSGEKSRNSAIFSFLVTAALLTCLIGYQAQSSKKESWQTEAGTEAISDNTVLLGGMPVGIYMETDGVMVLNTEEIEGIDGQEYEPAGHLVKAGDYITGFNNQEIHNKKELLKALENLDDDEVVLTLRRDDENLDVKIEPVESSPNEYKLGSLGQR